MSFEIHREPLYRKYRAPYYSTACLYAIVFGFLLIFIPFIIAYSSGDFWLKNQIIYEQPDVAYQYTTIFQLYGSQPGKPINLFYSSSNKINDLFQGKLRMSTLRSAVFDNNKDGLVDRIDIGLQVPLESYENITRISGMVYHDVTLKEKTKYTFDSVSYFNYDSGIPISAVTIDGDIMLRQSGALTQRGGYKVPYDSDSLLDLTDKTSSIDLSMQAVLQKVATRNISTTFVPSYVYGIPKMNPTMTDYDIPNFLNCTLSMRIPLQQVLVVPTSSQVLKVAWVQYAAFLLVIGWFLSRLTSFVFRNRLVHADCYLDVNIHEKIE